MKRKNELPLKDIQVVEFGQKLAGPMTGMILADLGATVIQIEKPDEEKKAYQATLNRGKYCISLDLKSKEGLKKAKELTEKADVIIENFRPNVLKRLGLDLEKMCEENPSLVTLSLPGFSKNDPIMKDKKATEAVLATHSGVFSRMGSNRTLMGIEPSFSPLPLASAYGSVIGASAIVMALQAREKTGYGDCIEVPLAAALTEGLIAYNAVDIDPWPNRYSNLREKEIARREENNIAFDLSYQELFSSTYMDPFFRPYKCKDGRTYYLVSIAHKKHPENVMKALGVYENVINKIKEMDSFQIEDVYLPKSEWGKGGSFKTYPVSPEWSKMISQELEIAFLKKTALEWEKILIEEKAIGGAHRTLDEWMYSEHSRESGLFITLEDPEYGTMIQPGSISWSEQLAQAHLSHSARKITTAEEALKILQSREQTKATTNRENAWLKGVKVLDLCNVIAGPHSATILARYGAEVIKIDPATPTFGPAYITYAFNTGQSKQSILVDYKTKQGYQVLSTLIKQSDIIILNATTKQIGQIKLDNESIKKINPNIIFCHLDLYGSQKESTLTNALGYDDVAQAVSGIMTRFGGDRFSPEEHAHLGTLDVMCGFAASLSIAVSLYRKYKNKEILRARTSLATMSGLLQLPYAYDYAGRGPLNEPSGRYILGNHSLSQFYKCNDTWLFLDSNNKELDKLEKIFSGISQIIDKKAYLTKEFLQKSTDKWLELLQNQDIACAKLRTMSDLREEFTSLPDGTAKTHKGSYSFTQWNNHPSGLKVNIVDPYAIQPKYGIINELKPTEKYGKSTYKILKELNYDEKTIKQMKKENIISESWSKEFYPS